MPTVEASDVGGAINQGKALATGVIAGLVALAAVTTKRAKKRKRHRPRRKRVQTGRQNAPWIGDDIGARIDAMAPQKDNRHTQRFDDDDRKETASNAKSEQINMGLRHHSRDLFCYVRNIAGRNPLTDAWLDNLLQSMEDQHVDVMCLIHITANGESHLTNNSSALLKHAIERSGKYKATIAFDTAPNEQDESTSGVCIINRAELTIRGAETDEFGRWAHVELAAHQGKSVHIMGAYGQPVPYSQLKERRLAAQNATIGAITDRMRNLHKPRALRDKSTRCKTHRQGYSILLTDTNSVFTDDQRPNGRKQGNNGIGALNRQKPRPNKEGKYTTGTNGSDGPGSLAYELAADGAISVLNQRFPSQSKAEPSSFRTYTHKDTWSQIDHVIVPSGKAFKSVTGAAIDAGNEIIWGSDHRGVAVTFDFETLFHGNKTQMYSKPIPTGLQPDVPKFTQAEIKIISHRMNETTDDWMPSVQNAMEACTSHHPTPESARGAAAELWRTMALAFSKAWTAILEHRRRVQEARQNNFRPRDSALRSHLALARRLQQTIFASNTTSLTSLVDRETPEKLQREINIMGRLGDRVRRLLRRYDIELPTIPTGTQIKEADNPRAYILGWINCNESTYAKAVQQLRNRVRINDQKEYTKWQNELQEHFLKAKGKLLQTALARRLDPVQLYWYETDPAKQVTSEVAGGKAATREEDPCDKPRIVTDPDSVLKEIESYFHEWVAHSRCPLNHEACTHTTAQEACEPIRDGRKNTKWITTTHNDPTARGRTTHKCTVKPKGLTKGANLAHKMAQPKEGVAEGWANSLTDQWTLPEIHDVLGEAATKDTRAGASGVSNRLLRGAPSQIQEALLTLFNTMQTHWVIPEVLALGLIQPIRKSNERPNMKDSRPITLLESPMKLFTKGLNNRMQHALQRHTTENNGITVLDPSQYGFLFNSSCMHALTTLTNTLEDANEYDKPMYLLNCDVSRAYDSVEFWSSEIAARRLKLPEAFIQIMGEFDRNAKSQVITPYGLTDPFYCERGMRQGDSLSPLRYLIFTDMILSQWTKGKDPYRLGDPTESEETQKTKPTVSAQGFVDDLLPVSSTHKGIRERADVLATFLLQHGVSLNLKKTFLVTLNHRSRDNKPPAPIEVVAWDKVNKRVSTNVKLATKTETEPWRYLGVWFTATLNFKHQHDRLTGGLNIMMRTLMSNKLSPEMIAYAINTVVIPCMIWAIQISGPSIKQLQAWDQTIKEKCRKYLNTRVRLGNKTDPLFLPIADHGMGVQSIEELLLQRQIQNLTVALNAHHTNLRETTRERLNAAKHRTKQPPTIPLGVRIMEWANEALDIQLRTPMDGPTETITQVREHLQGVGDPHHDGAGRKEKQHATRIRKAEIQGTLLIPENAHEHANAANTFVFASDGAVSQEEGTAGCALYKLWGPISIRWGGDTTTPILYEHEVPRERQYLTERFEVRHQKLLSTGVDVWPTALTEAIPVFQALATTPDSSHIIIYTDSKTVIDQLARYDTGKQPLTDLALTKISDRWLWEGGIMPLKKLRDEAGGSLQLIHVRSHVREKNIKQDRGLTLMNETADHWADKGRNEGHNFDLDPFVIALSLPYCFAHKGVPIREALPHYVRTIHTDDRFKKLRATKTGTVQQIAIFADKVASQGALSSRWTQKVARTPGCTYTLQHFAYMLRYGHLPTTVNLIKTYESGMDYDWLIDALHDQAEDMQLPSELTTAKQGLNTGTNNNSTVSNDDDNDENEAPNKTAYGADARCQACFQARVSKVHILAECPKNTTNRLKSLMLMANRLEGLGNPGALHGHTDPTQELVSQEEVREHIRNNQKVYYDNNTETSDVHRVRIHDPQNNESHHTIRIDHYWTIHTSRMVSHLPPRERYKVVWEIINNGLLRKKAQRRLPLAVERWLQRTWSATHTYQPHAGPMDQSGVYTGNVIQPIEGEEQDPNWGTQGVEKLSPATLRKHTTIANLLSAADDDIIAFINMAQKATQKSAHDKGVRVIALLPANKTILAIATTRTGRKHAGRIVLGVPAGRMPVYTHNEWATLATSIPRDSRACTGNGFRVVEWQSKQCRQITIMEAIEAEKNFTEHCRHQLRGGSAGMTLNICRGRATNICPILRIASNDPTTPDIQQAIRTLGPLYHWIVEPTAEAAKYEEPHTEQGTTCNETERYCKARDKLTETQEAYRQEQMKQMRKEVFCNAMAPQGLTTFLQQATGTRDAQAEAQALVAQLVAGHLECWKTFNNHQEIAIRDLYSKTGMPGQPPHLTHTNTTPEPTQDHPRLWSSEAQRATSLCCQGKGCQQQGKSTITDIGHQNLFYSHSTETLTCSKCRDDQANTQLLISMLEAARLPDFNNTAIKVWPRSDPHIYHHIKTLGPNLGPRDVAGLSNIGQATFDKDVTATRAGEVHALTYLAYLRAQKTHTTEMLRLWQSTTQAQRPLLTNQDINTFGLKTAMPEFPGPYLIAPTQKALRCESPLCRPGATTRPSSTMAKWRPEWQATFCNRCNQKYGRRRQYEQFTQAAKRIETHPIPAYLRTYAHSRPVPTTMTATCGKKRPQKLKPIREATGATALIWMTCCKHQKTTTAVLESFFTGKDRIPIELWPKNRPRPVNKTGKGAKGQTKAPHKSIGSPTARRSTRTTPTGALEQRLPAIPYYKKTKTWYALKSSQMCRRGCPGWQMRTPTKALSQNDIYSASCEHLVSILKGRKIKSAGNKHVLAKRISQATNKGTTLTDAERDLIPHNNNRCQHHVECPMRGSKIGTAKEYKPKPPRKRVRLLQQPKRQPMTTAKQIGDTMTKPQNPQQSTKITMSRHSAQGKPSHKTQSQGATQTSSKRTTRSSTTPRPTPTAKVTDVAGTQQESNCKQRPRSPQTEQPAQSQPQKKWPPDPHL